MTAVAVWAGIIVTSLDTAVAWYAKTTGAAHVDAGEGWATLRFPDGSGFELTQGNPAAPGTAFPSYGSDDGPPVMPGFAVEDSDAAVAGLTIARSLPGWIVVVAPGGLRVVIAVTDSDPTRGLVGFRFTSPVAEECSAFLERLGTTAEVEVGAAWQVIPVVAGPRDRTLADPDGNVLELRRRARPT